MHISQIKDLQKFREENLGREYYSIGPLQPEKGILETWIFTNDQYDQTRLLCGNLFFTQEEALDLFHHIIEYYNNKQGSQ